MLRLLTEHRDKLEALALALLEHETLDQDATYAAAGIPPHPARCCPPERRGYAGTAPRHGAISRSALRIARVAGERLSV